MCRIATRIRGFVSLISQSCERVCNPYLYLLIFSLTAQIQIRFQMKFALMSRFCSGNWAQSKWKRGDHKPDKRDRSPQNTNADRIQHKLMAKTCNNQSKVDYWIQLSTIWCTLSKAVFLLLMRASTGHSAVDDIIGLCCFVCKEFTTWEPTDTT
jgi:hypothetical protein